MHMRETVLTKGLTTKSSSRGMCNLGTAVGKRNRKRVSSNL